MKNRGDFHDAGSPDPVDDSIVSGDKLSYVFASYLGNNTAGKRKILELEHNLEDALC